MKVHVYLFFEGRCEEALDFYRAVFGGEIEMLMRYGEAPEPPPPGMVAPGSENKVMHASFRIGETTVMASDGTCHGAADFRGFSLAAVCADEAEARRVFAALADGGSVTMPIGPTFFAPIFGMLTDRFGIGWMISVAA